MLFPMMIRGNEARKSRAQPRHPWPLRAELICSILVLLLVVVGGFGTSIYWLMYRSILQQAESDLFGAAQLLVQDLQSGQPIRSLAISQVYQHRFGPAPRDSAYFALWNIQGGQVGGVVPLPPHAQPPAELPPAQGHRPFTAQTHGTHLDVFVRGPDNMVVMVGRPLAREFDQLSRLTSTVAIFGGISVLAGALGAWWLSRRIVAPLERLAQTAEVITEKNLHQRVQLREGASEVVRLSQVVDTMLERLNGAFERQVRFTADASHELRTPLAVILAQVEQTLSRTRTPEEYVQGMETCLRAARRMKRLVDELLLLARADSGKLEIRTEKLDLAELTRQAVALLEPWAREKQIPITTQLQKTPIEGDAQKLMQVVTNLTTNAVLYNRPSGTVFVAVHPRERTAILRVADTGVGIAAADQQRLFERFFRVDSVRTPTSEHGSGLGLSIVAEIVAAHAGRIEISSEPGVGTTFTVEFPLGTTDTPASKSAQD